MAKHVKTRGNGLTERVVVSYSGTDMQPAFEAWAARWNAALAEGGGTFGAVSLDAAQECRRVMETPASGGVDAGEELAAEMLRAHELCHAAIKRDEADKAARCAFNAGVAWATLALKQAWEADALSGASFREAGARGGRRPGETSARDRAMAVEFLNRRGRTGRSDSQIKLQIGEDWGLKRSAAIAAIERGEKLLSGERA